MIWDYYDMPNSIQATVALLNFLKGAPHLKVCIINLHISRKQISHWKFFKL